MKLFNIFINSLLMVFCCIVTAKTEVNSLTTDSLPSVIDLSKDTEGIITIIPPSGLQWFEASAVADMNNDGYDDIIVRGAKDYVSDDEYTPVIYVIYGGPNLPAVINRADPSLQMTSFTWQSDQEKIIMPSLNLGDFDGDGKKDIIFAGRYIVDPRKVIDAEKYNYRLYLMLGKNLINTGQQDNIISEKTPGLIKIYASLGDDPTKRTEQGIMSQIQGKCQISDINTDGKDDIIFFYPSKHVTSTLAEGVIYIVYGSNSLPSEINAENTNMPVTKILGDTSYWSSEPHQNVCAGDLDQDGKPDLIFAGGYFHPFYLGGGQYDYSNYHSILYVIYGQLLSSAFYREHPFNLHDKIWGVTKLTKNADRAKYGTSETYHYAGAGDINGDGYDDIFIGHPFILMGTPSPPMKIYILPGSQNYIMSGNIDQIKSGVIKLTTGFKESFFGTRLAFGDVNSDGFTDCLIGGRSDNFIVLYGRTSFPDSFQIDIDSPNLAYVKNGRFLGTGDFNNDGFYDIIGNKSIVFSYGNVFVILGRGKTFKNRETIVKTLPGSSKSKYTFTFADSSQFHFRFTYGGPSYNSELHLTNLGKRLPDSLTSIPASQKVVSFIQAELTNMSPLYTYRVQCSIDYTDSSLTAGGINEQDLIVSTYNEQKSKWEKLQTTIDTTLNRATFEVEHLSLFALTDKNDSIMTDVTEATAQIPLTFELSQNYPNPFNPQTIIRFKIGRLEDIKIRIYNILGQEVKTVISEQLPVGTHEVKWDGTDKFGNKVSSGIYIYRMETSTGYAKTRKLVYLK